MCPAQIPTRSSSARLFSICCAGLLLALAQPLAAQDNSELVGRKVLVIESGAELRTPEGVVWRAYLGDVFIVALAKDEWLWIDSKQGWLWNRHVVPFDSAVKRFTAAIQNEPTAEAYHARGIALLAHGETERALRDFDESIRRGPRNAGAYVNRGNAWKVGNDLTRALQDYTTAIELDPRNFLALNNRAIVRTMQRDYDGALADLEQALRLNEDYAEAYNNRGVAWREKQEFGKALADYTKAISIDPNFAAAYTNRAYVYKKQKKYELALGDYSRAAFLVPQSHPKLNDLAWMLATCPNESYRDGRRAVEQALRACELSRHRDWNSLDTLAAAYAEIGRFSTALKWARTALDLAPHNRKESIRAHLSLFEMGKPVRET